MHTTNYTNTFIAVAEDCPATRAEIPPIKDGKPSVAALQFGMMYKHPYKYTSDDVLFTIFAERNEVPAEERREAREQFFSKGQACLRASPLGKRYGWGIHCDGKSKVALIAMESAGYRKFQKDKSLTQVKAMRSKKR